MQIAQRLYQGIDIEGETTGLITYMRTDGTNISKDAIDDFRKFIIDDYGQKYLPDNANNYSGKKAKNAHEHFLLSSHYNYLHYLVNIFDHNHQL